MSSPAKSESRGWFSRIFGGSDTTQPAVSDQTTDEASSSPVESPTTLKKRTADARKLISDLSPTNGSSSEKPTTGKGLRSLASPVSSLLKKKTTEQKTNSEAPKRKRVLGEVAQEPLPLEDIFTQTTAKRFCSGANFSLIEEPIKISVPERLDATWSGDMGFGVDASPASSVRSLRSRLSGAASTTSSGLSSRTRAILSQLERVHTPASEARRMPSMRHAVSTSERWNQTTAALGSPAPPLRKIKTAVPTRLQLLSTNLGFNKKPYWKDIYRKPAAKTSDEAEQNGAERVLETTADADLNGSILAPIFDVPVLPKAAPKAAPAAGEPERKVSKLKGSDGISRNIFNTKDLDEDDDVNPVPIPKAIPLKMTAPMKGFMGDLNFDFALPKERTTASPPKAKEPVIEQEEEEVTSSEEDSDSEESGNTSVSDTSIDSSEEKEEEAPVVVEKKKEAPVAEKKEAASAKTKWSCSTCFVDNTEDKCFCCGTAKDGKEASAAPKNLISNLSSLPKPTTSVSFGFGASTTASTLGGSSFGTSSTTSSISFGTSAAKTAAPVEAKKTEADGEKRVAWDCPDCMVSNKAEQDACPCCGHVKYKSAGGASTSVFGANAFKPTTSSSTVSFGLSAAAPKPVVDVPKPVAEAPKPAAAASTGDRVAWDCPDCMVQNKADQDACPCCGHVKYKSAGGASTSVFGATAFKPTTSSSTVSFGLGSSTAAPTSAFSFGLSSKPAAPAKDDTTKAEAPAVVAAPAAPTTAATLPSITVSDTTKTSTPAFGLGSSLFGSSAPKFNGFGASATTADKPATSTPFTSTLPPLFGSFAAPKPADTVVAAPVAAMAPLANLFGAPSTSTAAPASLAPAPLFGASSAAPKENGTAMAPANPVFMFGASAAPTPSNNLFGNGTVDKPAAPVAPLFGSSAAAPAPMFSGLSGAPATNAAPAFASFSQPAAQPAAPVFGAPKPDEGPSAKRAFAFGASEPAAAPAPVFGQSSGSSSLFGNSVPSFGAFNAPAPTLSTSSSTSSLFSASTETPQSFNFGAAAAAPAGGQPFVFGTTAAPAPTGGLSFGQNLGAPAAAAPGGAFAFNAAPSSGLSAGARKIATARRRIPGRK